MVGIKIFGSFEWIACEFHDLILSARPADSSACYYDVNMPIPLSVLMRNSLRENILEYFGIACSGMSVKSSSPNPQIKNVPKGGYS